MHLRLKTISSVLALIVPAVHSRHNDDKTATCSADIPGLCSHDFEVINSTFGVILPPVNHTTRSLYEDDFIYKMIQPLPYGSAGLVEPQATGSNNTLTFISAGAWFNIRIPPGTGVPGTSLVSAVVHGQLLANSTSSLSPSGFALQLPPSAESSTCKIQMSSFYLHTKTLITAYARFQGCKFIKTTSPTTINFFRTEVDPIYTDETQQEAIFPIDNTLKTGSVVIKNIDAIRTSAESYNDALASLHLDGVVDTDDT